MQKVNYKLLNELKNKALSSNDLLKLVDYKATIIRYGDLSTYRSIEDVLKPFGSVFILYETKPNFGHWVEISYYNGNIEFFDSYGLGIDEQLNFISPEFRRQSNQDKPWLTILLKTCLYTVTHNSHQFQKFAKNVKSCGRYCALRVVLKSMPLKEFTDMFVGGYNDDVVSLITSIE